VALAHGVNVSVEAELGTIGNNGSAEGGSANIIYTDPDQAEDFVEKTGIDTLAVAIGTAHGLYPKDLTPKLNIELLKELNQRIDLPFVLHGGSGNPDSEVSEAVKYGVAKVNLSSDLKSVFFDALRDILSKNPAMYEPNEVYPMANEKVKEVVRHKLSVLNTIGKAELY
jgi:fructose-bisphosphate aldolase class II